MFPWRGGCVNALDAHRVIRALVGWLRVPDLTLDRAQHGGPYSVCSANCWPSSRSSLPEGSCYNFSGLQWTAQSWLVATAKGFTPNLGLPPMLLFPAKVFTIECANGLRVNDNGSRTRVSFAPWLSGNALPAGSSQSEAFCQIVPSEIFFPL